MKHRNFKIGILLALPMFFAACDQIDEADRYIEMPSVEVGRHVLLEEFTGQNCSNCPEAHRTIEVLKEQYGDALVTVSIHAGNFAFAEGVSPAFQTFKTPEGDTYAAMHGVETYPAGVASRMGGVVNHSQWSAVIREQMEIPTTTDIQLEAILSEGNIDINTTVSMPFDDNAQLQLWVTEDHIISFQLDGSTRIMDYEHNNVYRASVNGVGGERVFLDADPSVTTQKQWHHTIAVKDFWNAENLNVVAFVYNKEGVQQVVQAAVKSN